MSGSIIFFRGKGGSTGLLCLPGERGRGGGGLPGPIFSTNDKSLINYFRKHYILSIPLLLKISVHVVFIKILHLMTLYNDSMTVYFYY